MNAWLKNAIKNLIPLSVEKEDFSKAIKEWSFSGETIDYENPDERCQLCEMEGLRYHYQISNKLNNILWVGSKCIERFEILVLDEEGTEVSSKEIESYLKNKLIQKHIDEALAALNECNHTGSIETYEKSYLDSYCTNQFYKSNIHARILNYLFLRFEEEGIYFNKRFFSMNIKSKFNKGKLLSLNKIQYERIKGSLNNNQVSFYQSNKH